MKKTVLRKIFFCIFLCTTSLQAQHVHIPQLGPRSVAHVGLSALKTAANILSDRSREHRELARMLASIADGGAKTMEFSRDMRNGVSLGAHLHASLWRIAKALKEYREYKEKARDFDPFEFELEEADEREKTKKEWRLVCQLVELGLAGWLACGKPTKKQQGVIMIGRSICDLVAMFLAYKKGETPADWFDYVHTAAQVLPSAYDIGNAAYRLAVPKQNPTPAWGTKCAACGANYEGENSTTHQLLNCEHWCCENCARQHKQEIVTGRETKYFARESECELPEEVVSELHLDDVLELRREEVEQKKQVITCPCCEMPEQGFRPVMLKDPNAKPITEERCGICLENSENKHQRELSCGHEFCPGCIAGWLNTGKKTCPTCRKTV